MGFIAGALLKSAAHRTTTRMRRAALRRDAKGFRHERTTGRPPARSNLYLAFCPFLVADGVANIDIRTTAAVPWLPG